MRAFVFGLLAATALSTISFTAQPALAAPFGAASAPLTAEEVSDIKAEAAKIKREKAAAAKRAQQKREAAAARRAAANEAKEQSQQVQPVEAAEPVISSPVTGDEAPATITPEAMSAPLPTTTPAAPEAAIPVAPVAAPSPAAPVSGGLPITAPAEAIPAAPTAVPAAPVAAPTAPAGEIMPAPVAQ